MWPFKKKEVTPKIHSPSLLDYVGWRTNMWVVTPDGVGIIFKLGKICEIHLVDSEGLTVLIRDYDILFLRQAQFAEIPKARRQFSKEVANSLGYK